MIITQDWQLHYTDIYYISTKSATLWNSAVLVLLHSTSQCHKRQFNTVDSALRLIWENLPICTNEQVLTLLLGVANILNIFLCPAFQKCIFFTFLARFGNLLGYLLTQSLLMFTLKLYQQVFLLSVHLCVGCLWKIWNKSFESKCWACQTGCWEICGCR